MSLPQENIDNVLYGSYAVYYEVRVCLDVLLFSGCGSSCWLWEVWVFGAVCGVGWESWYWNIVKYLLFGTDTVWYG